MKPSSFDNILKNVQEEDLEKRKKREDEALGAYLDMQDELNNSLFPDYTMEDYVRQGRREKDDKEIQEKESLLKNVRDIKKKQNLNKESSVDKKPSGDKGQSGNKEPKLSERELTLQALKKNIEEMQKEPEKKELTTGDYLPDVLAGLYNIYNFAQGSQQPSMKIGSIAAARKAQQEEEAARQGKLGRMQKLYTDYLGLLEKDKDELSARDKAYLKYYDRKLEAESKGLQRRQQSEERIARQQRIDTARRFIKDDPRTNKAYTQAMALEDIMPLVEQVKSGNQAAAAALGSRLARAMGEVGVLTDADVTRYVQGTSWGRELLDWYNRKQKGSISEETLNDIIKNSKTISKQLQKNLNKVYKNAENRMIAAYPGMERKDVRGILGSYNITEEKERTITKKQYSPSRDKTKITYSDGSSEIFDGRK